MRRFLLIGLAAALACLAGCQNAATRIRQQPELFNSLDAATREKVSRGQIDIGFTPELVRLALGEPTNRNTSSAAENETVWFYRNLHRDPKDIVQNGYRRRVVFDPVLRAETIVVEPIDDRLAAAIAPKSLRVTFRDGRVTAIERVPEM